MSDGTTERLKDPSTLSFEQPRIRRAILASYWAIVLLAVPLWWSTTSIERLALPLSRIDSQSRKEVHFPIRLRLQADASAVDINALAGYIESALQSVGGIEQPTNLPRLKKHPDGEGDYTIDIVNDADFPIVESRRLSVPSPLAGSAPGIVSQLLSPYSSLRTSRRCSGHCEHLVAKYAPRYRLSFTLLNEDATSGKAIAGWDIQRAISRHMSPVLRRMSQLHNFTIESQVHFHSPLAFDPVLVSDGEGTAHGLVEDDLKVFVNSAEWSLASSVSNDPVLHFLLFIPSVRHTPMRILHPDVGISASNAFVLPQWGGIVIRNLPLGSPDIHSFTADDLDASFIAFRKQLLTLLGVSELPPGLPLSDLSSPLTDWQLDTLYRQRAIENLAGSQETLKSIAKLVDQIPNMPVGQDVRGDIQDSLSALEKASALQISPILALQYSAKALTYSSRAFFNPGMLALLYFPAEHTYAVYTPLFAPMLVPLMATAIREGSAWMKARKASRKT
ncbi:phosphatidylinositol-glycan biosynthesis class S protein-domain-containing protein [Amylostereum chailletii]|nr:phosphatidylinositol-glycan biosynthesis class S protein-domain-containing protein [Amylostereum chailletii]